MSLSSSRFTALMREGQRLWGWSVLADQGFAPRIHNLGGSHGLQALGGGDIDTRLPGLRVFPDREVVIDNPFFIDPDIRFSQDGGMAQEKHPGDDEPDSPEKRRCPLVMRILQKGASLDERPTIDRGG